jgi:hypothetical protein
VRNILSLLASVALAFGQTATSAADKAARQPAAQAKQRPDFIADDIEGVINTMATTGAARPKSEFETTEQYEARLLQFASASKQDFVFLLGVGSDNGDAVSFEYDADSQTMTANMWGVLPWLRHGGPSAKRPQLQVEVKDRLVGSRQYVGSNAYGVKRIVSVREHDKFGLALNGDGVLSGRGPRFSWPMTIEEAKAAKPFLRAAVRCVQYAPTIYKDEGHAEPTIDSPYEFITHYYFLPVLVEQVWIFDVRSGKILKKFGHMNTEPTIVSLTSNTDHLVS